ncbi:TPA: S-methyl-5'-thioadenosine phosphorylase [Candidatus Galligastranaerophilus intestinigallinarum]|nr:S-methyl-5'-thioadenosine phosphorylase [Candidatus Galligastranaerophilus intestinigallinarum]
MKEKATIGIFGGSGFYSFLGDVKEYTIETPYGKTSDKIAIGKVAGKNVAFMPRHGKDHSITPGDVNYRANIWAMKQIGCKYLISPCAAGSLQKEVKPGDIVFCDQFVDWTFGRRKDTFFEGPIVTHVSAAETYCPNLRKLAIQSAEKLGLSFHKTGTVVVINGPRFSSKAESKFFTSQGWHVINMTQYPESYLAKEMDMCPLNISLITDYDAGLVSDTEPVSHGAVMEVFKNNIENLKALLIQIITDFEEYDCACHKTFENSRV